MKKRLIAVLLFGAMLCGVLTGCGDDGRIEDNGRIRCGAASAACRQFRPRDGAQLQHRRPLGQLLGRHVLE